MTKSMLCDIVRGWRVKSIKRNDEIVKIANETSLTLKGIASLFGVSRQRVHQVLVDNGIDTKQRAKNRTVELHQKIIEMAVAGKTTGWIAQCTGVESRIVKYVLKINKVPVMISERDEKIISAAKEGVQTLRGLANKFYLTHERVRQILKDNGITLVRTKPRPETLNLLVEIDKLSAEGFNLKHIAEATRRSYSFIVGLVRKHKLQANKRRSPLHEIIKVGNVYSGWTVLGPPFRENGMIKADCQCLCGAIHTTNLNNILQGRSHSCRSCAARRRSLKLETKDTEKKERRIFP